MFEKIMDKLDKWNNRVYDWQRTSTSRGVLVFCLHLLWVIPLAFTIVGIIGIIGVFFFRAMGALLGI